MRTSARYHITALPGLAPPGSVPPLELAELRERFAELPWASVPVDVVLLQDDLTQRESFLSGESSEVRPAVLTEAQARNEAPLPTYLVEPEDEPPIGTLETDRLWESYFHYAAATARRQRLEFVRRWVAFEVGLRNSLAGVRAQRLGLAEADYLVAADLEEIDQDFVRILEEWTSAANPLAGLRVLIMARWHWVEDHDAWFTFRGDELAAYAAKLLLLHQWHRLARAEDAGGEPQGHSGGPGDEGFTTFERMNQ